jgi:hypothetical protein
MHPEDPQAKGGHFYFARKGTFLLCDDIVPDLSRFALTSFQRNDKFPTSKNFPTHHEAASTQARHSAQIKFLQEGPRQTELCYSDAADAST